VTSYSRILTSQGYVAVSAADGDEAMALLMSKEDTYHLLIVDLLMPVCDGWYLIEFVRNDERLISLPILAITGLSPAFDEVEKIKASCDDVMMKDGFEIMKFSDKVADLIAGKK